MDRGLQLRLIESAQAHLRAGTCDMAPAEHYNPVAEYHELEHARVEADVVFRRHPMVVGHASRLVEPGAFLTADVAGVPVVVIRQNDGSAAAFLNVCRHRGAKVIEKECGHGHSFACPYHAWTYGRDGSLLAIPSNEGFDQVDPAQRGLVALPTAERHGLLWVVPTTGATIDVADFLGDLDGELADYAPAGYVEERVTHLDVDCNWKLVVDGFLELYHLPFLHAETIGPYIHSKPTLFEAAGRHSRMLGVRKGFEELADVDPNDIDLLSNSVIVYQLFPNTVVIWQLDHFEVWTMWPDPDDPARSTARASLLAPADTADRTDYWDRNWKILMDTVEHEDFRVSRAIQRGLTSGAQDEMVFGRNEPALQHFHQTLARELAVLPN